MKDLKNSYPIELAEFSKQRNLTHEPAFLWWVPYTLKKRNAILQKIKSKYWERTHKYGIEIPKSVVEAKRLDIKNGNHEWEEAIEMEMKKIHNAVKKHHGDPSKLVGYEEITAHMIFDVKLGKNFRKKARYILDGHKTSPNSYLTYSTVVS